MTQKEKIKNLLKSGQGLTPMEALKLFGCFRLASVVHKLKSEGMKIETSIINDVDRTYAKYYMVLTTGQLSLI